MQKSTTKTPNEGARAKPQKAHRLTPGKSALTGSSASNAAVQRQASSATCPACSGVSIPVASLAKADPWADAMFGGGQTESSTGQASAGPAKENPGKCECGGTCAKCAAESSTGAANSNTASESKGASPKKSVGTTPPAGGEKRRPTAGGSATIQCDGSGGWEVVLNSYANATCGTKGCVTAHEESHIEDWKAKWPTGCKDQARGYLPLGDEPDDPLMTGAEYNAFLKASECKAHTVDLNCAKALPQEGDCKKTVEDYITMTAEQKAGYC